VIAVVELVLKVIDSKRLMPPVRSLPFKSAGIAPPADNRSKLLNEMLQTEKKYIDDLTHLAVCLLTQAYQEQLVTSNLLSRDTIFRVFANLSELLAFQRKFVIAMEGTMSLGPNEHRIGDLFIANVLLLT
jgi:cell division control protein 24